HHLCLVFFFHAPPTTALYTLSLHDALPICLGRVHAWSPPGQQLSSGVALVTLVGPVPPGLTDCQHGIAAGGQRVAGRPVSRTFEDRKSTRLNSSHVSISYAVFCLKKKKK